MVKMVGGDDIKAVTTVVSSQDTTWEIAVSRKEKRRRPTSGDSFPAFLIW